MAIILDRLSINNHPRIFRAGHELAAADKNKTELTTSKKQRPKMKTTIKLIAASAAAIILCGWQTTALAAASTVTTVASFSVSFDVEGCNGETVALSGNLNLVAHVTQSSSGNFNVEVNVDSQGLSGTGASGTQYQANTHSHDMFEAGAASTSTSTDKFVLIAKGKNPDLMTTMTMHYTLNANGTLTAVVDNFSVKCVN
jgi:hypothetical protein